MDLEQICEGLSNLELPKTIADRFEPQLTKLTMRMIRFQLSVGKALESTVKKVDKAERKKSRKDARRQKMIEAIAKLTAELEADDDAE